MLSHGSDLLNTNVATYQEQLKTDKNSSITHNSMPDSQTLNH